MGEEIYQRLLEWGAPLLGLDRETQAKIFQSVLLALFFWGLRWLSLRIIDRRNIGPTARYQWSRGTGYLVVTLAALAVGRIWFEGLGSVVTYLGILSAGLAVALQDVLKNLAGWLFILWRSPFRLGDRIAVGEHAGDVIDQRIFQFSLLEIGGWVRADQSTGRVIHVPNGFVFTRALINFSGGFDYIWCELPILVTFESNWRKAKRLLGEIALHCGVDLTEAAEEQIRAASRKYLIFYNELKPTVYTSVEDSGVLLTIRFLSEPRRRRGREESIWEGVLEAFAREDDIDFAYPTQRFYSNRSEGKPGAQPGSQPGAGLPSQAPE